MNRKSIALLAASHLLVITAGVLLARQTVKTPAGDFTAAASTSKKTAGSRLSGADSTPRKSPGLRPSKEWRGNEFARAWKAVRTAGLTTKDRTQTQRELLKQWAEVDLAAAVEAALGEEWDGDGNGYYNHNGPFLDVFGNALAKNPQESWEMIQARQFGLGTAMLRNVWIDAVGRKDPQILASKISEISWRDKERLINACLGGWGRGDATVRAAVFEILKKQPDNLVSLDELRHFMESDPFTEPATIKEEILRLQNQDPRMAKLQAAVLGQALASKTTDEISAEIADLPQSLQTDATWAALQQVRQEKVLPLMDLLLYGGAWDRVESKDALYLIQGLARQGKAAEVAQWATSMPFRKETTELFYRSVDTYLRDNPGPAREWIAGIENSAWRDRAYIEYSQQSLNAHKDPAASRWALNQVSDSSLKAQAEGWRSQWEQRNPGK